MITIPLTRTLTKKKDHTLFTLFTRTPPYRIPLPYFNSKGVEVRRGLGSLFITRTSTLFTIPFSWGWGEKGMVKRVEVR